VTFRKRIAWRAILPLAVAALPAVLLLSSVRTLREIDEQRSVYLRHRVALVAARLESGPTPAELSDEPDLVDLQVIRRGGPGDDPALAPIWEGHELFRTEMVRLAVGEVFRAYVPFHSGGAMQMARIDLAGSAADFLSVHARHNVIISSVAGVVLAALSFVAIWAVRKAERMRLHELEIEHLAHIGKMAAVLAHEIRNPLGTVKGFVQLAGESGDGRTRDLLAPALEEVRRLESLVNDLLAYGRPPSPQSRPVEWREVAGVLRGHADALAGSRPVRISVADAALEFPTDPALLGQALLNLLRNGVEAVAGGGEVYIEAREEHGELVVSVADNGPGISEEALAKLYEPFFTTKAFGTGLGLAITKRLVASLGGRLSVGRGPAGGTVAAIRLPGPIHTTPAAAGNTHGNDSHS
jgi:two-component system, NtrC family, sensor histidine kinase HydH